LLKTYRKLYGLNFITLRFANVYGSPRDLPQRVIPKFIDSSLKNLPFTINGGKQIIDFTFIDDVIEGIINVIKEISKKNSSIEGEDYNFATGCGISVSELAKLIKKIFHSSSSLSFDKEREYDVQNFIGEYAKAQSAFSYEPRHSLIKGLEKYKKRLEK